MVVEEVIPTQRETLTDHPLGQNDRIGCVEDGMGCIQPGCVDWRPMDSPGECPEYQLSGAASSILGTKILGSSAEDHLNSAQNGQHYGNRLRQPNGRYTFRQLSRLAIEIWKWCIKRKSQFMQSTYLVWRIALLVGEGGCKQAFSN